MEQKMEKLGVNMSQDVGDPPNYAFATENATPSGGCESGIFNKEFVDAEVNFHRLENGTATLPTEEEHRRKCHMQQEVLILLGLFLGAVGFLVGVAFIKMYCENRL